MWFLMVMAVTAQAPAVPPVQADAARVTVSPPQIIVEIDTGRLKGQPAMLAWSPDGQQLYLRTVEYDRWKNPRASHFLIGLDGKPPRKIDSEPAWAAPYWAWKSGFFAPGNPDFRINVESRTQMATSTNVPNGGDIAGMGGDPTAGGGAGQGIPQQAATKAAMQAQQVMTVTMKLKGELLGEWVNERPQPGMTFGWAPKPLGVIAFAMKDGGALVLMDREGHKQDVEGSKDCLLPAWSNDGTRVVYLQKKDKKKYSLMLVSVGA
jgi:hypothetical protein